MLGTLMNLAFFLALTIARAHATGGGAWDIPSPRKYDPTPFTLGTWGPDNVGLFAYTGDHRIVYKYHSPSAWGPANFIDGGANCSGRMATIQARPGVMFFFFRDVSKRTFYNFWDNGRNRWYPSRTTFYPMGEGLDSPWAVASWGEGRIDAVALHGGSYVYRTFNGQTWSNAVSLGGGPFASAPVIVARKRNNLDILGIDTSGKLQWKSWSNGQWTDWQPSSFKTFMADPVITSWGNGHMSWWALDINRRLWHRLYDGYDFKPWELIPRSEYVVEMLEMPEIAHSAPNHTHIVLNEWYWDPPFATQDYWYLYFDGTSWSRWAKVWGVFTNRPALISTEPGTVYVVGRNDGGDVNLKWWSDTGLQWGRVEYIGRPDDYVPAPDAAAAAAAADLTVQEL